MTTEPQFNELVIYTREVLTRFLEKRDPLLKLIEKDLIKLSKKQHSHIRHPNDGEKTLFEELDKILHRLVEFNIECGFKFICDLHLNLSFWNNFKIDFWEDNRTRIRSNL